MKQTILFSLKVWLTSVIVSPALYLFYDAFRVHSKTNFEGGLGFLLLSILYGIIISLPSWIILWFSTFSLFQLNYSTLVNKIWLSIIGTGLTILPFLLLFGSDDPITYVTTVPWALSYNIVIVAGIWFYKLKPMSN
jgi:hypothetical protein